MDVILDVLEYRVWIIKWEDSGNLILGKGSTNMRISQDDNQFKVQLLDKHGAITGEMTFTNVPEKSIAHVLASFF